MKKLIVAINLVTGVASADRLEDIKILDVSPGQNSIKLELQIKDGPKDSYFFVDISKSDPEYNEKLIHVIKKGLRREEYRLDLDIRSFSASPSGSYYRSEGIGFYGSVTREPDSVKSTKRNKQ